MIDEINLLLENKHQLLLEVSHELRSPLARMQLLIELIPEHKNTIKIREEVNFLESMIDNLLLSDRLSMPYSKLDKEKIYINEMVLKVVDLFPLEKNKIIVDKLTNDIKINVDITKFIIAIRNLIDNALKYNNNKNIFIKIENSEGLKINIIDQGPGIEKQSINKIVQPFYQGEKTVSTKGFGLGLTICKKIVEAHKGKLIIKSKLNFGSEFIIYLSNI